MPDDFVKSLWNPESYIKLLIVVLTYPIWGAVLKAMWQETKHAFDVQDRDSDAAQSIPRPPGEDPWVNIPRSSRRRNLTPAPRRKAPERRPARSGAGARRRGR